MINYYHGVRSDCGLPAGMLYLVVEHFWVIISLLYCLVAVARYAICVPALLYTDIIGQVPDSCIVCINY